MTFDDSMILVNDDTHDWARRVLVALEGKNPRPNLLPALKQRGEGEIQDIDESPNHKDIQAAIEGDGDSYARIIRRYQDALGRRMFRFSRDKSVVEELVHDVFVEAYFSLKQYRGDSPFEHWLQRIATRVGYRYWKLRRQDRERRLKLSAMRPASLAAAAETTIETDDRDDPAHVLWELLEKLPPRDRLVITLLHVEERTVAQAADLIGWSRTMVKVQAFRARGKLRKLLEGRSKQGASNQGAGR